MRLYLLVFVLMGCGDVEKETTRQLSESTMLSSDTSQLPLLDTQSKRNTSISEYRDDLQPDTTINEMLQFEHPFSLQRFYAASTPVALIEKIRSCPVAVFSNVSNEQYLLAYQYEGNAKNSFSCFEIGYVKDLSDIEEKNIQHSNIITFTTESGLQLGLSFEEVVKIKGDRYLRKVAGNETTLSYRIDDFTKSIFLKSYNMPGYFIELVLKEEKVIKIAFGFDYP